MENGYIKLWRTLKDNSIMQKSEYLAVWIYLLLSANHKDNNFIFNNENITVKAGSFITGRDKMAAVLKINRSKLERILKYLETEHQIEQQKTNKFRIISICNWNTYQESEQLIEQQVSNKRATSEQQVSTNKNDKNVKNDKNINIIPDKINFHGNINLMQKEIDGLELQFGKEITSAAIKYLSDYKIEKGYKTRNDNLTIRRWVIDAVNKNGGNGNGSTGRANTFGSAGKTIEKTGRAKSDGEPYPIDLEG
jgi:hypothetical protein